MCGEKPPLIFFLFLPPGSPPRVRGKGHFRRKTCVYPGITPACAGKRSWSANFVLSIEDHPRVCGEKLQRSTGTWLRAGSPPRVRGKVNVIVHCLNNPGITPACAGKSKIIQLIAQLKKDHPRVCGEKNHFSIFLYPTQGSPPRVRGKVTSWRC